MVLQTSRLSGFVLLLCLPICLPMVVHAADPPKGSCLGWIAVESAPEDGVSIRLDGKDVNKNTPATLKDVPCGVHTVQVSKPFYSVEKKKIKVENGEVAKARLVLKPNFASVEISTDPSGAKIMLDGKEVGNSPLKIPHVEVGVHTVEATLPDHQSYSSKIKLQAGKPFSLSVPLKASFGQLEITATPETNANVSLDGDALGTTPITLRRVLVGTHTVEVTKELFLPFEAKVTVRSAKTTSLVAKLKPSYGTLLVESTPPGGKVSVDGKERGNTPIELQLPVGLHAVMVEQPGSLGEKVERKVKVQLNKQQKLQVKLSVRTGNLMVDTVPFAADIELDGKPRGKAPLSLKEVPVGTHVIIVRQKGQPDLVGRIEVKENKTATAEVNLVEPNKSVYLSSGPKPSAGQTVPISDKAATAPPPTPPPKTAPGPGAEPSAKPEQEPAPAAQPQVASAGLEKEPLDRRTTEVPVALPPSVTTSRPTSTFRVLAWSSVGTAGAAAITSVILFGVRSSVQSDANAYWEEFKRTGDPSLKAKVHDLDNQAKRLEVGGWICAGVAVAAAGASVYFFLFDPSDLGKTGSRRAQLQISPLPGGGWIGLEAKF